ncbi:MAG: hypothetical protein ACREJC_05335 [Tepidisphaeraceae bacterium]
MPKSRPQPDVLVIGDDPSGFLAAALLRDSGVQNVLHCTLGASAPDDRLVTINPALFDLHALVKPLRRKLDLSPIYGLRFLADDPAVQSESAGKSISAYIASARQIRAAMRELARGSKVELVTCKSFQVVRIIDSAVEVQLDSRRVTPRILIAANDLPQQARAALGLARSWERGVVHRYTFIAIKSKRAPSSEPKALMPLSLDLNGTLCWAWLLRGTDAVQVAIEQPLETLSSNPAEHMLSHWLKVLQAHGLVTQDAPLDLSGARCIDLPFAGALTQEGLGNRTLLVGPAGGFVTACAEDVFPGCWSSVCAAEVARKALKERHVQDALQSYRHRWGATLGDYLRGPQQNLRFLLPLIYRNKSMTARLAEAILSGRSVVR